MTDLSRRLFLRALPAAPTAVKAIAKAALAESAAVASAAGMSATGMGVAPSVPMYGTYVLREPKMYALYKAGLLPNWAKIEIRNEVREMAYRIPPNIAALRSVSTSAKFAMSLAHHERKYWDAVDDNYLLQRAREAFSQG